MATDLRQTHFRFGKDDGTESSHTWWQLEDVNHSQQISADWTFLLRFCEQESGGTAAANTDAVFQYNKNGAGWVDITTTSSVVKAVAVGAFANDDHCTQRLSGTGTFETSAKGCTEDGSSGGPFNDIAASGNSETEAGLQVVLADVANNDVIEFRFRSPDWTVTYIVTPSLTLTVVGNVVVTPGTLSLTITLYTPTVAVSDNKMVTPSTLALALTAYAPTVTASDNKVVTPGTLALTLTTYAPTVTVAGGGVTVTPGTLALVLTTYAPTVTVSDNKVVVPGTLALTLTTYAPSVILGTVVTPGTLALVLTTYAPTVTVSENVLVTPGTLALVLTAYAPDVLKFFPYGGVFLYTAANWSSVAFSLEGYLRAITGTVYACLWDDTQGAFVAGSEISTPQGPGTFQRVRSGAITLVDGRTYRVRFGRENNGSGEFLTAWLIVVPT